MAIASIKVIPVNDHPINIVAPVLSGVFEHGKTVKVSRGVWIDSLDQCQGTMNYLYRWQLKVAGSDDIVDVVETGADSLVVTQAFCGNMIRVQEIVTDNNCGGMNSTVASAFSEWHQITKGTQTLRFDPIPVLKYSSTPYVLTASASSGFPVQYSIGLKSLAEVSNDTVYMKSTGSAGISAIQPGNECFEPTELRFRVLTIEKGSQSLSVELPDTIGFHVRNILVPTYSDVGLPIEYKTDRPDVAFIGNDTLYILATGSVKVTALQQGNHLYEPAPPVEHLVEVVKGDQFISISVPDTLSFGTDPAHLDALATSGLEPEIVSGDEQILKVVGRTLKIVGVGNCSLLVRQSGNEWWNAAPELLLSLYVEKGAQQLSVAMPDLVRFSDLKVIPDVRSRTQNPWAILVEDTLIATPSGNELVLRKAGTTMLKIIQEGTDQWFADTVLLPLVVEKGLQSIVFQPIEKCVFEPGLQVGLHANASSGLDVTYVSSDQTVAIVEGNKLLVVGAGTANIIAKQAGDDNWEAALPVQQVFEVLKAQQSIFSEMPDTVFVGEGPIAAKVYASSGLPVYLYSDKPDVAVVSSDSIRLINKGKANIFAHPKGDRNYFEADTIFPLVVVFPLAVKLFEPSVRLYPNPASSSVNLRIDGKSSVPSYVISFVNLFGEIVFVAKSEKKELSIDLQSLVQGVYLVTIQSDEFLLRQKLLVKR
jgi:hypothetical protein